MIIIIIILTMIIIIIIIILREIEFEMKKNLLKYLVIDEFSESVNHTVAKLVLYKILFENILAIAFTN